MTVCLISTPIEHVKAKLQIQYDASTTRFTGPFHCVVKTVSKDGLFGLWRGFSASLLFRSGFSILWASYEYYTRLLNRLDEPLVGQLI